MILYITLTAGLLPLVPRISEAAGSNPGRCPAGQVFDQTTTRCVSDKALKLREATNVRIGNEPGADAIEAATGSFQAGEVGEDSGSTTTTGEGSTLGQSAGTHMDGTITTL